MTLYRSGVPVAGHCAVLEIDSRGQPMRIECAVECRRRNSHIGRRVGRNDGGAGRVKRSKCPVAAEPGAGTVGGYDSEMVRGARTQATDVRSDITKRVPRLTLWGGGEP